MTLNVRRILSLVFILLFLTLTPAIMFYAAGYRLSINRLSFQRTGMFIINSQPEGAQIYIDGKPEQAWLSIILNKNNYLTTPAKIKNLLPGDYDVTIKLNGYWIWQKKLTVNPGASTFVEDIYLFKNDLPALIAPAAAEKISWSPDKTQALIINPERLVFYNLTAESEKTINQQGAKGKNIAWSADSKRIVVDNFLYDLNNLNSQIDLNKLVAGASNYKWSNNVLYFQDKNSIYQLTEAFSAGTGKPQKIIGPANFNDFLIKNGFLYLLVKTKSDANLQVIELSTQLPVKNFNLPDLGDCTFINTEQNLLNLYSSAREKLYLVDPADLYAPVTQTIEGVKASSWTFDNNLLYTNDFEVWLYNSQTKGKTLITRISDRINGAIMHPSKKYIIYFTKNAINAIELDQRDRRNISELVKFDYINSSAVNSDGDILYFSGRVGNVQGLYKLLLQ